MISKPIQQALACFLGLLVVVLAVTGLLQPIVSAAEAQFTRHQALTFEQQRIERAVDANTSRSQDDLKGVRADIDAQLFAGATINEAQGALQSLLSMRLQAASGLLNSMRLGETQDLKSGLTSITIDVTATLAEEQLMGLLIALSQAPQTLHIPKLSIQKKASYEESDTRVTIDLRAIGYWQDAASIQEASS